MASASCAESSSRRARWPSTFSRPPPAASTRDAWVGENEGQKVALCSHCCALAEQLPKCLQVTAKLSTVVLLAQPKPPRYLWTVEPLSQLRGAAAPAAQIGARKAGDDLACRSSFWPGRELDSSLESSTHGAVCTVVWPAARLFSPLGCAALPLPPVAGADLPGYYQLACIHASYTREPAPLATQFVRQFVSRETAGRLAVASCLLAGRRHGAVVAGAGWLKGWLPPSQQSPRV